MNKMVILSGTNANEKYTGITVRITKEEILQ